MPFDGTVPRQEKDAAFQPEGQGLFVRVRIDNAPETAAFALYRVNPTAKKAQLITPPGETVLQQSPSPLFEVIPQNRLALVNGFFVECHAILVGDGIPKPRLTCELWQGNTQLAELSYEDQIDQVLAFRLVVAQAGADE
jgi:hypothetical protein